MAQHKGSWRLMSYTGTDETVRFHFIACLKTCAPGKKDCSLVAEANFELCISFITPSKYFKILGSAGCCDHHTQLRMNWQNVCHKKKKQSFSQFHSDEFEVHQGLISHFVFTWVLFQELLPFQCLSYCIYSSHQMYSTP